MRAGFGCVIMLGMSATLMFPAAAVTVSCSAGPRHAEITDVPDGWTPVVEEGALSGTEVRGAGPTLELICKYSEAGELSSEPPPGQRVCRAISGTAFDCRRPVSTDELGPPVGSLKLVEGDKVDLDSKPPSKTTSLSRSLISPKAVDFIFANFVNTTNQPGYDAENNAKIATFVRRFPQPNECPLNGGSTSGSYFPLIDPATGKMQTGPMFSCVTTGGGTWYLTQLTDISRSDGKTRAALTWWKF